MAYRNNYPNRISSLMNKIDQNILTDHLPLNTAYSSTNLLDNYKYQNNYSTTAELNDDNYLNSFLSESTEDNDDEIKDVEQLNTADVLIQLERKKGKVWERKYRQLLATLRIHDKKHDNDKLCKKLSIQNRRFEGDGGEDDLDSDNQKTNQKSNIISSKNKNYQLTSNSFANNCSTNHRTLNLNDYTTNSHHNLKGKDMDKLIRLLNQQVLNDKHQLTVKDDYGTLKNCSNSIKNIRNNLMMNNQSTRCQINLDNQQCLNSLDTTILSNDLYLNDNNLKRQIINSMKTNFNSMIEFIENQSFSQDNFMAINQLINLIMMQNCQFMNHQQVLLCWLQKLQMSLSTSTNITRSNNHLTNHQLTNNLHTSSIDITSGDYSYIVGDNQLNELNSSTNLQQQQQHLNNHKLNNQQIESSTIKTNNNYYDNLKSTNSLYQNQLNSTTKMKNSLVQQTSINYAKQLNNKLNKPQQNTFEKQENIRTQSNQLKELKNLIEQLIENKELKQQNATGKLVNSYQEFDETPGAVGGSEDSQINEFNLNDNLHQNNLIQSNKQSSTQTNNGLVNNLNNGTTTHLSNGNHLTNGTNGSNVLKNNSTNKYEIYASKTNAVRQKTKTSNLTNLNTNSTQQRKNSDAIESINVPDEQNENSETIRPFSAAEGRSSDPTTTILPNQVKVLNNTNSSKINSTISSSTSINSIVAPANSSSNTNNNSPLLYRPLTTGGSSRMKNFTNHAETETDDDLAISNENPETILSENENTVNSTNLSNSNQIVESSIIDSESQIDEKFNNSHLNSRNDAEIGAHRLCGDGDF